jgi:hypothetical protein
MMHELAGQHTRGPLIATCVPCLSSIRGRWQKRQPDKTREALDNRSPVEAVPRANWGLRGLAGAADGLSRASLDYWIVCRTRQPARDTHKSPLKQQPFSSPRQAGWRTAQRSAQSTQAMPPARRACIKQAERARLHPPARPDRPASTRGANAFRPACSKRRAPRQRAAELAQQLLVECIFATERHNGLDGAPLSLAGGLAAHQLAARAPLLQKL